MADTPKPIDRWTHAERAWFAAYRIHGNMARAVREAGYDVDPDDYQRHATMGHQIAARPHIQAAIEAYREELLNRYDITPQNILSELAKVAFANLKDFVKHGEDGQPYIDLKDLPEHQLAALSAIQLKEGDLKITLGPKVQALELLGKWRKLWTDKLEVDGGVDPVARLQAARKRAGLTQETDDGQDET